MPEHRPARRNSSGAMPTPKRMELREGRWSPPFESSLLTTQAGHAMLWRIPPA